MLAFCSHLEAFGNEYKKTKSNTDEARQCYASGGGRKLLKTAG